MRHCAVKGKLSSLQLLSATGSATAKPVADRDYRFSGMNNVICDHDKDKLR